MQNCQVLSVDLDTDTSGEKFARTAMQPSTTTILGLPENLCSAPSSRSPMSGAPNSKKQSRWRRSRYRKNQLSLAFETSSHPEKTQVRQWAATPARAASPISARSLRYSDSDYYVILMADLANQTPPGYHQCTFGGSRTPHACAKRLRPRPTTKISQTVIE
jgi:hypothetical protein